MKNFDLRTILILGIVLASSAFVQLIAIGSLPVLPVIAQNLQISTENMQFVVTFYLGGLIISQLLVGFFAAKLGRRHLFLTSLVCGIIGLLLWTQAHGAALIYLSVLIIALGAGGILALQNVIIKDTVAPEYHARLFGMVVMVMYIMAIIAPIVAQFIVSRFGWQFTLFMFSLYPMLILALAVPFLKETNSTSVAHHQNFKALFSEGKTLFSNKLFMGSAIIGGLMNSLPTAFNTAAPFLFKSHFKLPDQAIGWYLSIPNLAIFIGLILADVAHRYWDSLNIIRRGVILSFIASLILVTIAFNDSFTLLPIVIVTSIAMLGMGFITPHYWSAALSPLKSSAVIAAATVVFSQQFFAIITSFVIATTHGQTELPMTITIFVLATLAMIINIFMMPKTSPLLVKKGT